MNRIGLRNARLPDAEIERRFKAYKDGTSDADCASRAGITQGAFSQWRKKYKIPCKTMTSTCGNCGRTFTHRSSVRYPTKYCDKCRPDVAKTHIEMYYGIRGIRHEYADMCVLNPVGAVALRSEMAADEGPEFVDMALDGITPDTAESSKHTFLEPKLRKKREHFGRRA